VTDTDRKTAPLIVLNSGMQKRNTEQQRENTDHNPQHAIP
jgi:hypothetical protein